MPPKKTNDLTGLQEQLERNRQSSDTRNSSTQQQPPHDMMLPDGNAAILDQNKSKASQQQQQQQQEQSSNTNGAASSAPQTTLPELPGEFLFHFDQGNTKCAIALSPVASTGDVYHLLAYVFLSNAFKVAIPSEKIILTYDLPLQKKKEADDDDEPMPNSNKEIQDEKTINNLTTVKHRSMKLIEFLNVDHQFCTHEIKNLKNDQANARMKATRMFLKEKKYNYYIDQRATTGIVCKLIEQDRSSMTRIIRDGFSRQAQSRSNQLEEVNDWVTSLVKTILADWEKQEQKMQEEKIVVQAAKVILNARASEKASGQCASKNGIKSFEEKLKEKGYVVWVLPVFGGGFGGYEEKDRNPFHADFNEDHTAMIRYVRLLVELFKLQKEHNIKIVGNTAGTLDCAAFMGHDVFNIHKYENGEDLVHQTARLMTQRSVMKLCFTEKCLLYGDSGQKNELEHVIKWLEDSTYTPQLPETYEAQFLKAPRQDIAIFRETFNVMKMPNDAQTDESRTHARIELNEKLMKFFGIDQPKAAVVPVDVEDRVKAAVDFLTEMNKKHQVPVEKSSSSEEKRKVSLCPFCEGLNTDLIAQHCLENPCGRSRIAKGDSRNLELSAEIGEAVDKAKSQVKYWTDSKRILLMLLVRFYSPDDLKSMTTSYKISANKLSVANKKN